MKNSIKLLVLVLVLISLLNSCTKSAEKVKIKKQMKKNIFQKEKGKNQKLNKKTLSKMDSIFEKTSKDIDSFVSKYNNWADSYVWISKNKSDKPYNEIRLCGSKTLPNIFIIEKRSTRSNSKDVVGYSVERKREYNKSIYSLETSFFRNNKEIKTRKKYFVISTSDELITALKPFYRRLKEAKQDTKKNISRIEKISEKF